MKKITILSMLFLGGLGLYLAVTYISTRPKMDGDIHLNFGDLSYDHIRSAEFEIMSGEIIVSGKPQPTDAEKLSAFIGDLQDIRVINIATKKRENFQKFGITDSAPIIEIGEKKISLGGFPNYEQQFVKPVDEEVIYLIDENISGMLSVKNAAFFKPGENKEDSTASPIEVSH